MPGIFAGVITISAASLVELRLRWATIRIQSNFYTRASPKFKTEEMLEFATLCAGWRTPQ
jgi:hypothetical protein